MFRSA